MPKLAEEDLKAILEKYGEVKLKGGLNPILENLLDTGNVNEMKSLKEIMVLHEITESDIAALFGYANSHSFNTSKANKKMVKGLELFYHIIMKSK